MVSGEDAANHVLVDLNAESQGDLLGNSGTTPRGIALLHLDDGFDQFLSGSLRTGLGPDLGRRAAADPRQVKLVKRFVEIGARGFPSRGSHDRSLGIPLAVSAVSGIVPG